MTDDAPADGQALRALVRRAERGRLLRGWGLVAPLLLLLFLGFIAPIGQMLLRSIDNSIAPATLPRTVAALESWDPAASALPPEAAFAALVADLRAASRAQRTRLGARLNYEQPGLASLFRKTPRRIAPRREAARAAIDARIADEGARAVLASVDKAWEARRFWVLLKRLSGAYTDSYLLSALDRERDETGAVRLKPEDRRIHLDLFGQTFFMSLQITLLALLLGYPVAYLLASLPPRRANLLLILVLLPFWTSLLARTSAWQALLQDQGVVNDFLLATGLNSVLYSALSLVATPEVESLCRDQLRQILAGGGRMMEQMAANAQLKLSSCAVETLAAFKAGGEEAALRLAAELRADGEVSGFGDERFTMTNNRAGVVIAMTQILLPFMILPLYAVMRGIPPEPMRAARSLGASNWTAFRRVYLPASLPGLAAGCALTFILAVGYYITPEILGGAKGRFISNQIAYHIIESLNWGLAAALAAFLLLAVLALYLVLGRLSGADRIRLE